MKYFLGLICFSAFIISFESCKKDNAAASNLITGSWELRQTSSAMLAPIDYPAGNGTIIKFTGTRYENYVNGNLVKSGQYKLIADATAEASTCLVTRPGEYTNRIIYDNNDNIAKEFIQVVNNKLTFISGCYANDLGHSSSYERVANK